MINQDLTHTNNRRMLRHLAVIMDGNGRWARQKGLPRTAGHLKGIVAVRKTVRFCLENKIKYLTLFGFSSENWKRPQQEVDQLMKLLAKSLVSEVPRLNKYKVRIRFIGDLKRFDKATQEKIERAQNITSNNQELNLNIAINYGGRWDILQACKNIFTEAINDNQKNLIQYIENLDEQDFNQKLSLSWAPDPDLLIRTGGEQRVSNFLLWQLAYAELYFCDVFWPNVNKKILTQAINWYADRERRYGKTSEQLKIK